MDVKNLPQKTKIKTTGIILPKQVRDLYTEQILIKGIKEDPNERGDIWCSRMKKLNTVKIGILAKLIYIFNLIPVKITAGFFVDMDKIVLKFIWKGKETRKVETI